jgi:hypothetical protein
VATPVGKLPHASVFGATPTETWIPLDAEKLARRAWETYKGRYNASDGQVG